jgi:cytochrome b561
MLNDTQDRYGLIAILLHWGSALAIAYLWFLGPEEHGVDAATFAAAKAQHIAMASGLASLLIARILWRLSSTSPKPLSSNGWLNGVATAVKMLLLLDLLLILVTGFSQVWLRGETINVFGVLALPSPLPTNSSLALLLSGLHKLGTNIILLPLVGLHVLGALKHVVLDRDGTFGRMIWPARQA